MKKAIFGAALLLLTGNALIAQNSVPVVVANARQQKLFAQEVSTYKPEDSYSLPWPRIMENDIAWKKRVWRDIDARKPENRSFDKLTAVLVDGFFKGAYKAYSAATDRFNTELTKEQFISLLTPGSQGFNPATITKFRIKEDWLYILSEDRLVVRMVGIAPVREVVGPDGKVTSQPVFWLYYPDTRNFLAQQKVVSKEKPYILNWDNLMEGRHFKGDIDKVITK